MKHMQLQTCQGEELTMSSREIAELTAKQHKDVMRDIRKMLAELGERKIAPSPYLDSQGKEQPEYHLPKRETYIAGFKCGKFPYWGLFPFSE